MYEIGMSKPTYVATKVSTDVAYGEQYDFIKDQFKTVPIDYKFTILESKGNKLFWENTATFSIGPSTTTTYTVFGTGFYEKGTYKLNGSGVWKYSYTTSKGLKVEIDFTVYQNLVGKKRKNGYITFVLTEDGQAQTISIDGKSQNLLATYTLANNFCAKRLLQ